MTRTTEALEYRFVVPGVAISFRSPKAKTYKRTVARIARPILPLTPRDEPIEIRLDYFHVAPRRFDMDNVAKCVMDALSGIAYRDDRLATLQSARAHDLTNRISIYGGPVDLVKPLRWHENYLFVRIRLAG
jgi:Holliday junction resolvase RusA-like endonuclease